MRYFFHLRSSDGFVEDLEGVEFDSSETARLEAVNGARDMVADGLRAARRIDLRTSLEVQDEAGELLHLISFEDALGAGFHPRPPEADDCRNGG